MIKVRNETGESPCFICDFVCSNKQKLAHHTITEHHGPNSLVCSYCKFKFKDVSSVRRHIKTVHMQVKEFMCSYCNKKYKHKYDLEKHFTKIHKSVSREGQNFCSECQTMCFGWEALKKHYLDAHGKTIQHIKCPQCIKIFFDVSYLKQHFRRVHHNTSLNVVICQTCGAVFEEHLDLIHHMEEKHFWNSESAVFCGEVGCHELFEDVEDLDRHRVVYHSIARDETATEETSPDPENYKKDLYPCPECEQALSSKIELVAHLTESHKWRSVMECQKCGKLFSTSAEVQEHLNSHYLEPADEPLLPTGKQSILKKRLLKRKNIKDLSQELEPRFFIRMDPIKNIPSTSPSHEVVVETNNTIEEVSTDYHAASDYQHDSQYHDTAQQHETQPQVPSSSKRRLLTGPPTPRTTVYISPDGHSTLEHAPANSAHRGSLNNVLRGPPNNVLRGPLNNVHKSPLKNRGIRARLCPIAAIPPKLEQLGDIYDNRSAAERHSPIISPAHAQHLRASPSPFSKTPSTDQVSVRRGEEYTSSYVERGEEYPSSYVRRGEEYPKSHLMRGEEYPKSHLMRGEEYPKSHLMRGEEYPKSHLMRGEEYPKSHLMRGEEYPSTHVVRDEGGDFVYMTVKEETEVTSSVPMSHSHNYKDNMFSVYNSPK